MLAIKYMLMTVGYLLLAAGVSITIYDLWRMMQQNRALSKTETDGVLVAKTSPEPVRWRTSDSNTCER